MITLAAATAYQRLSQAILRADGKRKLKLALAAFASMQRERRCLRQPVRTIISFNGTSETIGHVARYEEVRFG